MRMDRSTNAHTDLIPTDPDAGTRHIHKNTYTQTHKHTNAHTCVHTHTHTHTHAHKHTLCHFRKRTRSHTQRSRAHLLRTDTPTQALAANPLSFTPSHTHTHTHMLTHYDSGTLSHINSCLSALAPTSHVRTSLRRWLVLSRWV